MITVHFIFFKHLNIILVYTTTSWIFLNFISMLCANGTDEEWCDVEKFQKICWIVSSKIIVNCYERWPPVLRESALPCKSALPNTAIKSLSQVFVCFNEVVSKLCVTNWIHCDLLCVRVRKMCVFVIVKFGEHLAWNYWEISLHRKLCHYAKIILSYAIMFMLNSNKFF